MPLRVVKFALRHSGKFFGGIICYIKGSCKWQDVQFGDDDGVRKGRICARCKREEMTEKPEETADKMDEKGEEEGM